MPQWTERKPADLGMALVELLAYVGDYLSYQQDAIATEAYLGTARRRVRCGATRAWWTTPCTTAATRAPGCRCRSRPGQHHCSIRSRSSSRVLTRQATGSRSSTALAGLRTGSRRPPASFETDARRHSLQRAQRDAVLHMGRERAALPKGATRATLPRADRNSAGDVLIFIEASGRSPAMRKKPIRPTVMPCVYHGHLATIRVFRRSSRIARQMTRGHHRDRVGRGGRVAVSPLPLGVSWSDALLRQTSAWPWATSSSRITADHHG